ncbi:MAG: hypothetical protein L0K41_03165 [Yaniella sp.]|uniref:hypothetical protein n=1 Tax=Corynebacterium TaxID=1716 RepID=UPI0026474B28|nr:MULTISPECIES: hypothetical protein [Corynebacterium]MDN6286086.1 hypothetical protein [Corynebacterium casei]MDN6424201.1 hypothetical protein [Bifidobacterium crudilactis]MDN6489401.1 hypothetical protein [Yaniella sp.]MDN6738465.1 hypothetical protein [Corynebacterium sp.]
MSDLQKYENQPVDVAPSAAQSIGTQTLQNLEEQAKAMGNAMTIANAMCSTGMVPKQYKDKPEDGAAAILYGAELGLNAIQSLQQIMVINGKPGIETRTAVALLKKHGYEVRTVETSDESVTVEGIGPNGEHEISTWTMARAETAGYTSNSLYKKIPQQMLYSKAAMEVARKIAPHVLSGIAYSVEELRLEPVKMTATRKPPVNAGGMDALEAAAMEGQEQEEPQDDSDAYVAEVAEHLATLDTQEQVNEFMASLQAQDANLPAGVLAAGRARWEELNG